MGKWRVMRDATSYCSPAGAGLAGFDAVTLDLAVFVTSVAPARAVGLLRDERHHGLHESLAIDARTVCRETSSGDVFERLGHIQLAVKEAT
ncbi:hypothetical protein [Dyella sp.]|uniref:hypothetical protein n=1 Tax=Dyella sp. TaxID=1869338 RepID=UPI002ED47D84